MASVERVSVALTPEVADMVRRAVESGEYFSDNEVVAEALREWMLRRTHQDQFNELRDLWTEGLASGPGRMLGETVICSDDPLILSEGPFAAEVRVSRNRRCAGRFHLGGDYPIARQRRRRRAVHSSVDVNEARSGFTTGD